MRDHITMNLCCSAAGQKSPPFIILERSFSSSAYSTHGPENAVYAKSPNGCMDEELFFCVVEFGVCVKDFHFRWAQLTYECESNWHLHENNIVLYSLLPHTTNVLQPLDVSVFCPFKNYFSKITDQIKTAMFMKPITINKTNFSKMFKDAFDKSVTMTAIQNRFRKCGIYPFDRNAIEKSRLMPSNNNKSLESTIASASASSNNSTNNNTLLDVEFQVDQSQDLFNQHQWNSWKSTHLSPMGWYHRTLLTYGT